jgi:hypothetical protein
MMHVTVQGCGAIVVTGHDLMPFPAARPSRKKQTDINHVLERSGLFHKPAGQTGGELLFTPRIIFGE